MDDLTHEEITFYIETVIPNLQAVERDHDFLLAHYDNGEAHMSEVIWDYQVGA